MLVRWPDDPQEKLLVFRLLGEGDTKTEVVQELAKMMASINFSTDSVSKCAQLLCIVQYMHVMYLYMYILIFYNYYKPVLRV